MAELFDSGVPGVAVPADGTIPIDHLDYAYVNKCEDYKELGSILALLKSGREGHYPDVRNSNIKH